MKIKNVQVATFWAVLAMVILQLCNAIIWRSKLQSIELEAELLKKNISRLSSTVCRLSKDTCVEDKVTKQ